ncbi:MAG TPA: hypothetical protein VKY89_13570 [Thermoanaerobaculia bacterium]|nr:hypothetical protein [Thermoanaerobaculia bacterium]
MKRSCVLLAGLVLLAGALTTPAALRSQSSCELCVEYQQTVNGRMFPQQAQCCPLGSNPNDCTHLPGASVTGSVEQAYCYIVDTPNGYECGDAACDGGGSSGGGAGGGGGGFCSAEFFDCKAYY